MVERIPREINRFVLLGVLPAVIAVAVPIAGVF
jgi:hypothetical protein